MLRIGLFTFLFLIIFAKALIADDCEKYFGSLPPSLRKYFDKDHFADLESQLNEEVAGSLLEVDRSDLAAVANKNSQIISFLNSLPIKQRSSKRSSNLNKKQLNDLFKKVQSHKVAGNCALKKYDPKGSTGFCFGRAMSIHIEALRMGLDKNSIRKIWAVGNLKSGSGSWKYHVATIVRGEDGWYAIDPIFGNPIRLEDWYKTLKKNFDASDNMRIFATEAKRFGPGSSEPYNHWLLHGRDFNRYFDDLLEESRIEAFETLKELREQKLNDKKPPTFH